MTLLIIGGLVLLVVIVLLVWDGSRHSGGKDYE
jgi:hypothetical protein